MSEADLEVQATQEYTGQQRHVCRLGPMWSEVLRFRPDGEQGMSVGELARGGLVAVSNVGDDPFWTGHPPAQANLYTLGGSSRGLGEVTGSHRRYDGDLPYVGTFVAVRRRSSVDFLAPLSPMAACVLVGGQTEGDPVEQCGAVVVALGDAVEGKP